MVLSNPESSGNKYKEVTSPMSVYQSQLKGHGFAKKDVILICLGNMS